MVGMAKAEIGADLLLANETLDPVRLQAMADEQDHVLITVAVDSFLTVDAAAAAGIQHVLIDVNVGLPRCGIASEMAAQLAEHARGLGLVVRGVMGYEGHLMMAPDRHEQELKVAEAMGILLAAHRDVGGDIISGGGTGTWDINPFVNEMQAGSYALMDTQYATLPIPFAHSLVVWSTVISTSGKYSVCDAGLKSLGMDHGNPSMLGGSVWFCSDEHVTFSTDDRAMLPRPGHRVALLPAHVDPTCALHERMYLVDTATVHDLTPDSVVIEEWAIDLRGW
jgi:D-serine deaminase-like pyridoxal phosphate-dependent protein